MESKWRQNVIEFGFSGWNVMRIARIVAGNHAGRILTQQPVAGTSVRSHLKIIPAEPPADMQLAHLVGDSMEIKHVLISGNTNLSFPFNLPVEPD